MLANGACHSQSQVRVDVDLANCHRSSLSQHVLWNALCAGHLTAVCVDHINKLWDNRGCTMQNDGESRNKSANLLQDIKAEFCFTFKFVSTVAGTNSNGQGVYSCPLYELLYLFGLCIAGIFFADLNIVLYAG